MKRIIYISGMLCAVLCAGCTNDEMSTANEAASVTAQEGEVTLTASTGATSRTSIDKQYQAYWSKDDALFVFGVNEDEETSVYKVTGTLSLSDGAGATQGTFTGIVTGNMSCCLSSRELRHENLQINFSEIIYIPQQQGTDDWFV